MRGEDGFFRKTASVLGVHNLPYLGTGAGPALAEFGLAPAHFSTLPWWAQDMPLALGLLSADHIVPVSPTYAQEILTPEFGTGLQDFLRARKGSITGILNGLDVQRWDPEKDPALKTNYSVEKLSARQLNKKALQAEFGLPQDSSQPVMAMITRLDYQKGADLLPEALRLLASTPGQIAQTWQLIVLGMGDTGLEAAMRSIEAEFPRRVRAAILFDQALSRRVYAGADLLLIPSRYEPCGMAQMIAMRYGCVPLGRATGGLRDTIQDFDASDDSTGFLFEEASAEGLAFALLRALEAYRNAKAWQGLQERGMQRDYSWARSAQEYLAVYQSLVQARKGNISPRKH
jgi:starch synthase